MRLLTVCLCLLLLSGSSIGCGDGGVGPDGEPQISILFIGNSLTMSNDLPGMVAALLDSAGAGPV